MTDSHKNPSYKLRIPAQLRDWFKQQAAVNNRSLNGEIVFALQQHYKQQQTASEKTT